MVLGSAVFIAISASAVVAGAHGHPADPFAGLERENQAARRAEQRDRAEAADEISQRTRERERDRLNADDVTDELRDDGDAADE